MFIPVRPSVSSSESQRSTRKEKVFRGWRTLAIPVTLGVALLLPSAVEAGAMDWLQGKLTTKTRGNAPAQDTSSAKTRASAAGNDGVAAMPDFFAPSDQLESTGQTLSTLKFVEAHWTHSRQVLETVSRSLAAKVQIKRCSDISAKLFQIVTGLSKESLKNSGGAIQGIAQSARELEQHLLLLGRIITAPGSETLSNLESAIQKAGTINDRQYSLVKSYLAGAESLINLGSEAYQTLELIPLLSINALDTYIGGAKQVMKQIRSNGEAMKGLLLNLQTGCEQVNAGLELMTTTLKTTLRFSDHFAFKQFALINLPIPSREKLFSQVGMLKNSLKGMQNTLEIGDSQVKNSTQQYAHLVEEITSKIRDHLQYQTAVDAASGNLPQISTYAHNQVLGLFQRAKQGIAEMRVGMNRMNREALNARPPQVAMESPADSQARVAEKAAAGKLPLFLLGGKAAASAAAPAKPSAREPSQGKTTILYSEQENVSLAAASKTRESAFRPDEVDILTRELGSDLPYMETALGSLSGAGNESLLLDSPKATEDTDILQTGVQDPADSFGRLSPSDDDQPTPRSLKTSSLVQRSPSSSDLELLNVDVPSGSQETGDLLPMLRLDDSSLTPDRD